MNTIRTGLALPITRVYLLESGHRPHASYLSGEIKNLPPQTINYPPSIYQLFKNKKLIPEIKTINIIVFFDIRFFMLVKKK